MKLEKILGRKLKNVTGSFYVLGIETERITLNVELVLYYLTKEEKYLDAYVKKMAQTVVTTQGKKMLFSIDTKKVSGKPLTIKERELYFLKLKMMGEIKNDVVVYFSVEQYKDAVKVYINKHTREIKREINGLRSLLRTWFKQYESEKKLGPVKSMYLPDDKMRLQSLCRFDFKVYNNSYCYVAKTMTGVKQSRYYKNIVSEEKELLRFLKFASEIA